jgi:hypothetical protein
MSLLPVAELEIFVFILGDLPASMGMFSVRFQDDISMDEWEGLAHSQKRRDNAAGLTLWKVRPLYSLYRPMY